MKRFTDDFQEMLYLKDTAFQDLMQKRIYNVLLIATPYDAFMIEEDGRVDEQVYFEYVGLNLSSPPRFTKVSDYREAFEVLSEKPFDLIIAMPGADVSETFSEAKKMKELYPSIPIVALTTFSREVRRRLENEDLSGVDYVFSWLGNVQLIVAIIKLLEDRMNAEHDISEVGVQSVMIIEDSIRFYSSILPHLFNYLLTQSKIFATEALNDHERMLRMRGRPKVLLARDYEEAKALYDQYGENMLGIISDVRFPISGKKKEADSGLKFAQYVHEKDPTLPVIFESSEINNKEEAEELGCAFLYKDSKTLPQDLRDAVSRNFGFGDFVVRNPITDQPIMYIQNLKQLQKNIFNIPNDSLFYHSSRNDISRWLYSRALFPIASVLKIFRFTEMSEAPAVRKLVFECIVKYRKMKNRGVVAIFRKDRFDKYSNFARIGEGSLGGKGRGLAFIDQIIKRNPACDNFNGVQITIPRTVVICTDIFDQFMDSSHLYPLALSDRPDQEILDAFLKAKLPQSLHEDLEALLEVVDRPLAVRSSSLLEDSHYQPFAGVYSTYMIPHIADRELQLQMLEDAIKGVYASVFFAESKAYMNATSNIIDQEKMAVILQEVAGELHNGYYYPTFSGVGRSLNYYPTKGEKAEDGVAELAAGLGKYIVDGGMALRFSPRNPRHVLQTSTLDLALRDTQTNLYAIPEEENDKPHFMVDDSFNIARIPVSEAFKSGALNYIVSTYNANDHVIRDTWAGPGRKLVTFANVLQNNIFPLPEIVDFMLSTGSQEMGLPVEIEFAGNINPDAMKSKDKGVVYWLQIRPIVDRKEMLDNDILEIPDDKLLLKSTTALGHGTMDNVKTVVYVKPSAFDSTRNPQVAQEIAEINKRLVEEKKPYILIGPGRWGSSDHALGIPVNWASIAGARLIAEAALPGYRIEPSQGSHFFQNLTSFGVGYFTIDESAGQGLYDSAFLDAQPAVYESDAVRIVEFPEPLKIAINGKKSYGVVVKPEAEE